MGLTPPPQGTAQDGGVSVLQIVVRYAAPIFLLLLIVVFALLEPRFLHPLNIMNVLRQVSISGLVAVGMTFVILTAGIDLSVGSLLALSGLVCAWVSKGGFADRFAVEIGASAGNPVYLAAAAAILVGMAGGLLQGAIIAKLRVPPFVVTLGGLTAFRGLALLFSGGGPISGFEPDFTWWGQGRIWSVPVPVIIFFTAAVAGVSGSALHPVRQARLCGRRQRTRRRAERRARGADHDQRLRHQRILLRPRGLPAVGAAQLCRGRRGIRP
jgi:ribose/xylose/arabinose/galactoside ABC-type transport system permease subunit